MTRADADSTELAASPGSRLRRAREAQGLSEQQAAEALNLDPMVITELEANDFAALGAPVFVRGHLRRYAGYLGLPEDDLVAAYEGSKQHIEEPVLVPRARFEMEPVRGRPRWPWVVGGTVTFLLAALLIAWLSEHDLSGSEPASNDSTGEVPAVTAIPAPSDAPTTAPVPEAAGTEPLVAPISASPESAGESAPTQAAQATAGNETPAGNARPTVKSSTPPPIATPTVQPRTPPSVATPAVPPSTPPPVAAQAVKPVPGKVKLKLRFNADSWVEVFDGSGKVLVYDLAKGGSERTVTAKPPLSVTLGNPAAVGMVVNGRSVVPPRVADSGAMARFSISSDGSVH